jgi:hypothetical protein
MESLATIGTREKLCIAEFRTPQYPPLKLQLQEKRIIFLCPLPQTQDSGSPFTTLHQDVAILQEKKIIF